MRGKVAYVMGDAMTDRYSFGRVLRISPEAPVPIFLEDRLEDREGGAANVAANLKALGLHVWTSYAPQRCIKHRYFVGQHQVFRQDHDRLSRPDYREISGVVDQVMTHPPDVIVLSDYSKGWLSSSLCQQVIKAAEILGVPIVVDPKGADWSRYKGASVICPNQVEYDNARAAGAKHTMNVLIKQGDAGATLVRYDAISGLFLTDVLKARARRVYDVTGAGDTVTAVVAAFLSVGADLYDAANFAMIAAGHVVGEIGTAVCSDQQLAQHLKEEGYV